MVKAVNAADAVKERQNACAIDRVQGEVGVKHQLVEI